MFETLIYPKVAEPDFLQVNGRLVSIPLTAKGVAKFTFNDLCEKKLSAIDYITICKNYHTVFIYNIPILKLSERDSLRRFITLIDELYQHKVKLICSAEESPEKLFLNETTSDYDEVFSFDRTVSRLNEMQTKLYLQNDY